MATVALALVIAAGEAEAQLKRATERMRGKPGDWTLELQVNDKPAGSYTFALK